MEEPLHFGLLCPEHRREHEATFRPGLPMNRLVEDLRGEFDRARACASCAAVRRERTEAENAKPTEGHSWHGVPLVEREPGVSFEFWSSRRELEALLERAHLFPLDVTPRAMRDELRRIEHGGGSDTPAGVRLADGTFLPRVYFVEKDRVLKYGVPFWTHFVGARHITSVVPSPFQIPPRVSRHLFRVVETSMSSLEFLVKLKDGTSLACWYPGPSDFIELPPTHVPAEIVGVKIGRGLARGEPKYLTAPDFVWCVLA